MAIENQSPLPMANKSSDWGAIDRSNHWRTFIPQFLVFILIQMEPTKSIIYPMLHCPRRVLHMTIVSIKRSN